MIITLKDNDAYSGSKYTFDTEAGKIGEGRHVNAYVAQFSSPKGVMPVIIKEPKFATLLENDRIQRQSEVVTDNFALPHVLGVIPVQASQNKIKKDLAIEYVRGITLTQFIGNNLKPKYEAEYVNVRSLHNKYLINRDKIACEIIKDVAKAIEDMHSLGVSHEELTADDILVTAEGSVRLSSTGQAQPKGSFSDDLLRIGVLAYQLCSCDCDLGHVDIDNVKTTQMREFITNALSRKFDTISELCEALSKIDNFEITSEQKGLRGLFGSKRKTVYDIDASIYGIYIPGVTPLASSQLLEAEEENKRKTEEEAKRKSQEEAKRKVAEEAKRKAEEEAKRKAEEETKRKAEEAKRKAQEKAKRQAEEEEIRKEREAAKRKLEEAKAENERIKTHIEAERIKAQEERKKIEEEKKKAEEERRIAEKEREEVEKERLRAKEESQKKIKKAKKAKVLEWQTSESDSNKKKLKIIIASVVLTLLVIIVIALSLGNNDKKQTSRQSDKPATVTVPTEQKKEGNKANKQERQNIESKTIEQQFTHQEVEGKAEVKTKQQTSEVSNLTKHNSNKAKQKVKASSFTKRQFEKKNTKEKKAKSSKPTDTENTESRENSQRALGL